MIFRNLFHRAVRTAFAGLILLADPAQLRSETQSVEIDPEVSHGTWEGWGTSLSWWAKVFGNRNDIADLLFTMKPVHLAGENLPGLGFNIARYNAGACSWSHIDGRKMVVSKIIKPYRQIEGFWLDGKNNDPQSTSWNWSVDANQRAMLLKARDRGTNWFELFSNSPMWWMCANDNPSGAAETTADNLPPKNYAKFAIYLATIARVAKDRWGIAFTTVEPFNEPVSKWWFADCKQEGCHFSSASQAAFLPLLRAELDRRGLKDMPIAASDENTYDEAVATWNSFGTSTRQLIAQLNVHGYQYEKGQRDLVFEAARKDNKRLWNSEYGEADATGLKLARNLQLDFRYLRPTAWCYWQPFDNGGWALLLSDLSKATIAHTNPKYFVLAQYSRHIRPGMVILETGDTDTIAAYDSKARKLVIVVRNGDKAGSKTFDLSKFNVGDGLVTRWITEPKGTTRYKELRDCKVAGKHVEANLPADSIQTFEVENVSRP